MLQNSIPYISNKYDLSVFKNFYCEFYRFIEYICLMYLNTYLRQAE